MAPVFLLWILITIASSAKHEYLVNTFTANGVPYIMGNTLSLGESAVVAEAFEAANPHKKVIIKIAIKTLGFEIDIGNQILQNENEAYEYLIKYNTTKKDETERVPIPIKYFYEEVQIFKIATQGDVMETMILDEFPSREICLRGEKSWVLGMEYAGRELLSHMIEMTPVPPPRITKRKKNLGKLAPVLKNLQKQQKTFFKYWLQTLEKLMQILKLLQDAKFAHLDIKLNNFVVNGDRICLIDPAYAAFEKCPLDPFGPRGTIEYYSYRYAMAAFNDEANIEYEPFDPNSNDDAASLINSMTQRLSPNNLLPWSAFETQQKECMDYRTDQNFKVNLTKLLQRDYEVGLIKVLTKMYAKANFSSQTNFDYAKHIKIVRKKLAKISAN